MPFRFRASTLYFVILFYAPMAGAQSLLSILSQKTYEFSRGDACYKDSKSNVTSAAASCAQCNRKGACPVASISEVNESLFFDQAAREYLSRTRCWEKKVESLDARKKEALLTDVKLQLPLIVDLYNQLQALKLKRADYIASYNPTADNKNQRLSDFNLAEKEISGQLNVLLSATWFGGHFIGKKALLDLAVKASAQPERYIAALQVKDLEKDLLLPIQYSSRQEQVGLLRKSRPGESLQKKVISTRTKIMTPTLSIFKDGKEIKSQRRNGLAQDEMDRDLLKLDSSKLTFNLNDEEKIKLFREIGLGDALLKKTPEEFKRNANLICQLNGRYGATREAYETAISGLEFVASMALPLGPYVASAKGLISARSAVVLSTFASAGMSVATLQKECGDSAINYKTSPSCDSKATPDKDFVEELSNNSCLMGAGFTVASFATPYAAKAFNKLRAIKAPAVKVPVKAETASLPKSAEVSPTMSAPASPTMPAPASPAPPVPAAKLAPVETPSAKAAKMEPTPEPKPETKIEPKPAESVPETADAGIRTIKAPVVEKDYQMELWKIRESGDLKKAKVYEEKLAKKLKSQKMKDLGPVGGNTNSGSHFVELEDGTKGIWKPRGKTGQLEEVAAYEVDSILEMNYVPMTVAKSLDSKPGTFQLLIGDIESAENISHPDHLMMYDYLITNYDRNGRNYGRAGAAKRTAFWDHEPAFSGLLHTKNFKQTSDLLLEKLDEAKKTGKATLSYLDESGAKVERTVTEAQLRVEAKSLYSTMTGSKSVYENLKKTSESQWRQRMQGKLTEAQIDILLKHRDEIIQSVERARRVFGNDVFAEGAYSPLMRPTILAPPSH